MTKLWCMVMDMNKVFMSIKKMGIVPVVTLERAEDAKPLAKALYEGGLPCAEITFRTDAAKEALRIMANAYPDMLIGAGTVLTTEQVDMAIDAGAAFIVSPGLNPEVVKYCISKGIPVIPGCATPSDMERAIELGLRVVKFFPAEAAGGLNMIKALSAPFATMQFMPTGGINEKNVTLYLDFPKIIACGGSWMVKEELICNKEFSQIKDITKKAVNTMLGFEVSHIEIYNLDEKESIASSFETLFGFEKVKNNNFVFAGTSSKPLKENLPGKYGQIAVVTNYMDRAIFHLERRGAVFLPDTARYDEKGNLTEIYMKNETGGFAIHLLQKKREIGNNGFKI